MFKTALVLLGHVTCIVHGWADVAGALTYKDEHHIFQGRDAYLVYIKHRTVFYKKKPQDPALALRAAVDSVCQEMRTTFDELPYQHIEIAS